MHTRKTINFFVRIREKKEKKKKNRKIEKRDIKEKKTAIAAVKSLHAT